MFSSGNLCSFCSKGAKVMVTARVLTLFRLCRLLNVCLPTAARSGLRCAGHMSSGASMNRQLPVRHRLSAKRLNISPSTTPSTTTSAAATPMNVARSDSKKLPSKPLTVAAGSQRRSKPRHRSATCLSVNRPARDYFLTVFERPVRWELTIRLRSILICCSSMSSGS